MSVLMSILGLISGIKQMQSGNTAGGAAQIFSSFNYGNNAGSYPKYKHSMPFAENLFKFSTFGETDAGARRNYL